MGKSIKQKVLFLGVGLYNYDDLIYNELSKEYDVSYIYLVPVKKINKWKFSFLAHFGNKESFWERNSKLLMLELEKVKGVQFDYIFVIKGSRLENNHMEFIEKQFPSAKKILYLWDSWSRIENRPVLQSHFDNIYSFDSEDCKKYGFKLRPLFYSIINSGTPKKYYDVSFIGTNHSDRLEKLRTFKKLCEKYKLNYFLRLKTTHYPIICSLFNVGGYRRDDLDILTNRMMAYTETMDVVRKSKVVIDLAHPLQTGLTIRTLEALAMGCKLLTSNQHIREYEDIPPECYCIISEGEEAIINFLRSELTQIPLLEHYSLPSFIKEMLN